MILLRILLQVFVYAVIAPKSKARSWSLWNFQHCPIIIVIERELRQWKKKKKKTSSSERIISSKNMNWVKWFTSDLEPKLRRSNIYQLAGFVNIDKGEIIVFDWLVCMGSKFVCVVCTGFSCCFFNDQFLFSSCAIAEGVCRDGWGMTQWWEMNMIGGACVWCESSKFAVSTCFFTPLFSSGVRCESLDSQCLLLLLILLLFLCRS